MSDPKPEHTRHEIKFNARASELARVAQWVQAHAAGFLEPYPQRRVNNVYFDTFELFAFAENLSGASRRSKVRYRWYGDTFDPPKGVLEVKRRRSGVGWKLSYQACGTSFEKRSWSEIRAALRASLPAAGRVWLDANPAPAIINRYDRRYFVSGSGKVRLTLDCNQQVFDQRLHGRPNLRRRANMPDSLVVELKFAQAAWREASSIVQGIPFRLSRNSKYVIGVRCGDGL